MTQTTRPVTHIYQTPVGDRHLCATHAQDGPYAVGPIQDARDSDMPCAACEEESAATGDRRQIGA